MTGTPHILAAIVTRDGNPPREVLQRVATACEHFIRSGAGSASLGLSQDGYTVARSRNLAVHEMFTGNHTHLWMIDADVTVQTDALTILAGMDADIAAGCYPHVKRPHQQSPLAIPYLTLLKDRQWSRQWFSGVREFDAAGTGCMLIRREVFEQLGHPWFMWREWMEDGQPRQTSDDIDFCQRARAKGFRVFAHGNVRCGHTKRVDVANFITPEGDSPVHTEWNGPRTWEQQQAWNDYGSHVPALCSVARALPVRTVLEYGSGRYSTGIFLDRKRFPHVEKVVSLESDANWWSECLKRHSDNRLTMFLRPLHEFQHGPYPGVEHPDLVMIDCDTGIADEPVDFSVRADLLHKHASQPAGVVVVHDVNFAAIRPAFDAAKYRHKAVYAPEHGPYTGVLSNDFDVSTIRWLDVPAA